MVEKSFVQTDSSTTGSEFNTRSKHLTTPGSLANAAKFLASNIFLSVAPVIPLTMPTMRATRVAGQLN